MSTPFLSELRLISWNFPPKGWAFCNGQTLAINQNQALFALLGTTYGGNGQTTFGLPDLRGRVAMHQGSGHTMGERGGEEFHTIIQSEMPAHTHFVPSTSTAGNQTIPTGHVPANSQPTQIYSKNQSATTAVAMSPLMISSVGGSQPHENRQPFLVMNYIIALQGIFPSQN
ncbi:MAG TPA: tail fiber protein [Candidatus Elarobacter sp.]|jgi:microcystin-dependent protein|nr:tail fiber protein [Candidatus Elarobacter sp.]